MNAYVQPMGQPAPGSAKVGYLYTDLQTRTLWLGVDPAVDATGSVLISDMLNSMAAIEQSLEAAKDYTDDQLAHGGPAGTGYALLADPVFTGNPKAPTPATADNDTSLATTAFVKAAIAADVSKGVMVGMILMYSGLLTDIGVGTWADWHLCDGSGGTPDLRNRFVMGAGHGDRVPGAVNPAANATTNSKGAHTHPVSNVNLTLAQLPAHTHGPGTLGGKLTGASAGGGSHAHIITCCTVINAGAATFRPYLVRAGDAVNAATDTEAVHTHTGGTYVVDITTGATQAAGSGTSHTHTTDSRGDHTHNVTSAELRDALPYMALAYIMKIS